MPMNPRALREVVIDAFAEARVSRQTPEEMARCVERIGSALGAQPPAIIIATMSEWARRVSPPTPTSRANPPTTDELTSSLAIVLERRAPGRTRPRPARVTEIGLAHARFFSERRKSPEPVRHVHDPADPRCTDQCPNRQARTRREAALAAEVAALPAPSEDHTSSCNCFAGSVGTHMETGERWTGEERAGTTVADYQWIPCRRCRLADYRSATGGPTLADEF